MKKNSLEARKKQHEALLEAERREQEKKTRRDATRQQKHVQEEIEMKKVKFNRGRVLPRREYKAKRRQEKLAK